MANTNQEIRELRNELEALRASIASEAKNGHYRTRAEMRQMAHDLQEDAREAAQNVGASLRNAWTRGRSAALDGYAAYETSVARHPVSATAIAVGCGILLGALMRRR